MNCTLYVTSNITVEVQETTLSPQERALVTSLKEWETFFGTRISVALCCFGVLGNILNLLALTRRSLVAHMGPMEKSATCGLVALALSDLLFCLLNLPNAFVPQGVNQWVTLGFAAFYAVYGQAVINVLVVSSTWLTVVMAVSRYFAICHPLHARLIVGMKFAKASILAVFIGSVALVLPRFWHYQTTCMYLSEEQQAMYPSSSPTWYQLDEGLLGRGSKGWRIYIICHFILAVFVPVLVLAFCNVYLVRALHQSTKMRNQFTRRNCNSSDTTRIVTLTLTVIVVINIVLVAPCEVFTFIDQIMDMPINELKSHSVYNFMVAIFNALQIFSFSFNFVLYILINAHFRRAIMEVLTCNRKRDSPNGSCNVRYDSVTANTNLPMTPPNRLSDEDISDKKYVVVQSVL